MSYHPQMISGTLMTAEFSIILVYIGLSQNVSGETEKQKDASIMM